MQETARSLGQAPNKARMGGSGWPTRMQQTQEGFCLAVAKLWHAADSGQNSAGSVFYAPLCLFVCAPVPSPDLGCQLGQSVTGNIPQGAWAKAGPSHSGRAP